ncbi:MAG: 1-acyl-sn-glycerol-3-phosphate acyltransferase [Polyangiaceae bacterium]|nr:1-acyl-sn-glycerol-3-phosphate acyltransferase [Polyangiaceae bacterium]
MPNSELSKPYEPNLALRALYALFFDRIKVDPAWVAENQRLAAQGSVVHVMGNLNLVDFLALDHLTKRLGLPSIRFVNDLGLWVANPDMGQGWSDLFYPRSPATQLRHAITSGGSALLFLRRPRDMVDLAIGATRRRGRTEGGALMKALLELQRKSERPIRLVPQVFVWTRRPEPKEYGPLDIMLAPREWPNVVVSVGQFLTNYHHVAMRVGEPLDVRDLLADAERDREREEEVRQRATYVLLRRIERERRGVTGPAQKPPDRVRLEIVQSPKLRAAIDDLAGEREADRAVLTGQALAMLRELQARPDPATRRGLELLFHRVFHSVYAGIEFDPADIERVRRASRDGTLILLPSHKSHFDYFSLGYLFNRQHLPLPIIAAGDNLNFFPLGQILRRGGAFFIRRSFKGDRLYAAVVDAYIRRLLRDGYPIEVFLEGTRSRTGKLLTPKVGLLNMVVDAAVNVQDQKTYFVPVSIGYEHIAELNAYERELGGADKRRENAAELLKTPEVLRHRYGRLNIQIGQILTIDEVRAELELSEEGPLTPAKRRAIVTRIGNRVMDEINRVTAVTPSSLAALALLNDHPRRTAGHRDLYERCDRLLGVLRELGARITPATALGDGPLRTEALREAVQLFLDSELIAINHENDEAWSHRIWARPKACVGASYYVPEQKRLALDVSKNMILHFFVERGLVATALLMPGGRPVTRDVIRERVQRLSRLFKHEFRFRADAPFDEIFASTIDVMLASGELAESAGGLDTGPGRGEAAGLWWVVTYANMLKNFLEGYRIAARALLLLVKTPATEKDLVRRALAVGSRMVTTGEVERREAVCKPLIENAIASLMDEEYLRRDGERLELAESFRDAKAVTAIEGRIAGFMGEV